MHNHAELSAFGKPPCDHYTTICQFYVKTNLGSMNLPAFKSGFKTFKDVLKSLTISPVVIPVADLVFLIVNLYIL